MNPLPRDGPTLITLSPRFVPSAGHAVVCVKLRLDVADASQQFSKHRFPVTAVTGLDTSHPLYCVAVHLHCAVAMRTKGLKTEKKKRVNVNETN